MLQPKVNRTIYIPQSIDNSVEEIAIKNERSYSYVASKLLESALKQYQKSRLVIASKPVKKGGKRK